MVNCFPTLYSFLAEIYIWKENTKTTQNIQWLYIFLVFIVYVYCLYCASVSVQTIGSECFIRAS